MMNLYSSPPHHRPCFVVAAAVAVAHHVTLKDTMVDLHEVAVVVAVAGNDAFPKNP